MAKTSSLSITSLNEYGYGVGQRAGQTLTVARTAPGDQVLIGGPKSADRWSSAELVRVVKPGPGRVASPCEAFDQGCGGCQWLHLDASTQTHWKEKNLASLLRTRADFQGRMNPLVTMETPVAYRNKLSLKNQAGKLVFVPETDDAPVAPRDCLVQTPALQAAWAALKGRIVLPGVEQVHLRSNDRGQVGIHVFVKEGGSGLDAGLKALFDACPGAVGVGATGRSGYRLVTGAATLAQTLGTTTWLIPHNGFFQTNALQAGRLLDLVRHQARATRSDRVLDLYCGAGFFGLALAADAQEVVGIEENPQSVEAAQASAAASGIGNARFLAGDLGAVLGSVEPVANEVAVIDPPREGLLPRALALLVARAPKRIVYVSCYPQSLVRDLKALVKAGWKASTCTPIDMFPHTSHVETVITLDRSVDRQGPRRA
jgi:tRNA/tmRNA/rRNA uracil-C5-methylase (TrmA/RlmC/RlmD family)